ncbi:MAG: helix-turn-helix domain-containing protein [Treponema sp.]|jgi:transcriptional regulator with XRE-family HTH domain|nr:helix-turn-helix domain-containing protein [Treponema sp.]
MKKSLNKYADMSINQRIVLFRHELKMTQKDFAKKICISTSFQASIEIEQKKVLDRHIKLIVSAFGVNEAWLRTGEGEMFEKDVTPDYKITETVELFKQLNPFFQDFIMDQLYKLLEYERTAKEEAKKRHPAGKKS